MWFIFINFSSSVPEVDLKLVCATDVIITFFTQIVKKFIFLPSVSVGCVFIWFTPLVFKRLETNEWKVMIFVCESVPDERRFTNCLMNSLTLFLQIVIRRWGFYFLLLKKRLFPVLSPVKAIERSCLWVSVLSPLQHYWLTSLFTQLEGHWPHLVFRNFEADMKTFPVSVSRDWKCKCL